MFVCINDVVIYGIFLFEVILVIFLGNMIYLCIFKIYVFMNILFIRLFF